MRRKTTLENAIGNVHEIFHNNYDEIIPCANSALITGIYQ